MARQTIAERFTWHRVAIDYLKEFERLASAKRVDPTVAR
jgi:hypothetical protein